MVIFHSYVSLPEGKHWFNNSSKHCQATLIPQASRFPSAAHRPNKKKGGFEFQNVPQNHPLEGVYHDLPTSCSRFFEYVPALINQTKNMAPRCCPWLPAETSSHIQSQNDIPKQLGSQTQMMRTRQLAFHWSQLPLPPSNGTIVWADSREDLWVWVNYCVCQCFSLCI
jgi:hypothetical protein